MGLLIRTAVGTLLCLIPFLSRADAFYELLRHRCNVAADTLEVEYVGAYNEAGECLFASRTPDDVNPWDQIEMEKAEEPKFIAGIKAERRRCRLSDGVYDVELAPIPCNRNVLGFNGAMMMASAQVRFPGRRTTTAEFGGCNLESDVKTKLLIRPTGNVRIEGKTAEEYFK
jgi:hypothetical protein